MLRFPVAGATREVARGTRDARVAGVPARSAEAPRAVRNWRFVTKGARRQNPPTAPCALSSQLHTNATHHRITREVARGTRDARAAGVRARASRWRRAPYVTGGSSSRGLGDKTLQLRPFFPIAYHHHTPPPRRSIEGGATRDNGGDPVGDVGASGALPDTRGAPRAGNHNAASARWTSALGATAVDVRGTLTSRTALLVVAHGALFPCVR